MDRVWVRTSVIRYSYEVPNMTRMCVCVCVHSQQEKHATLVALMKGFFDFMFFFPPVLLCTHEPAMLFFPESSETPTGAHVTSLRSPFHLSLLLKHIKLQSVLIACLSGCRALQVVYTCEICNPARRYTCTGLCFQRCAAMELTGGPHLTSGLSMQAQCHPATAPLF